MEHLKSISWVGLMLYMSVASAQTAYRFFEDLAAGPRKSSLPKTGENYQGNYDAQYVYQATTNALIAVTFESFQITDCPVDGLTYGNGATPPTNQVGSLCNVNNPGPLIFTGNQMWMSIKTNAGDGAGSGATWTAQQLPGCGGQVTANALTQNFSSPTLNNAYVPNLNCLWIIKPPTNEYMYVDFTKFQLETDCAKDYVQVGNGMDPTKNMLHKKCGTDKPPSMKVKETIYIQLKTDSAGTAGGITFSVKGKATKFANISFVLMASFIAVQRFISSL